MAHKVVIVGLGSMGAMMARLVLEKGMKIVAAFTRETHLGKDLGEALDIDKRVGVLVSNRLHEISGLKADVALYATVDRLEELFPQIMPAIEAGINVISIGGRMNFPRIYPEAENIETGTYWTIKGRPSIEVSVKGTEAGEEGALATTARAVNSIPIVLAAKPGLVTQKDLPVGPCLVGQGPF